MASNESLVKVNSALFSAARVAAKNHQRSISEQLSLWITLGQLVESKLTNSEISSLINDAAELRVLLHTVEKNCSKSGIDIFALAMSHQNEKQFSDSSSFIRKQNQGPVYEGAVGQPGLLRQINPDGSIIIGTFKNGKFTPTDYA